jgi:hypothetical protein
LLRFALPSGSLRLAISTSFRFAAARFWNVNPSDWLGLAAALFEVLFDGEQPRLAVFFKVRYADAVHAAGPCVGLHLFPCQLHQPPNTVRPKRAIIRIGQNQLIPV